MPLPSRLPRKALRQLLRKFGYDGMERERLDRLRGAEQAASTLGRILKGYFSLQAALADSIYLLQLGANDGRKDDSIAYMHDHPKVRSALVEPQSDCLESLRRLHAGHPRVTILPCAFGTMDSSAALYRFDAKEEKGIQLNVFSSFTRSLVEGQKRYFCLRAEITTQIVETCTLRTLLQRAGFLRADILISDIEGHDHAVVEQALATLDPLPRILVFEHRWLPVAVRSRCYELLDRHGYGIVHGAEDAFCFRLEAQN